MNTQQNMVLSYLMQAREVFDAWSNDSGDPKDVMMDREPIIGIAQMLQAQDMMHEN